MLHVFIKKNRNNQSNHDSKKNYLLKKCQIKNQFRHTIKIFVNASKTLLDNYFSKLFSVTLIGKKIYSSQNLLCNNVIHLGKIKLQVIQWKLLLVAV